MSDPLEALARLRYQPRPGRWAALAAQPPRRKVRAALFVPALLAVAAAVLLVLWPRGPHFDLVVDTRGQTRSGALTSAWFETGDGERATVKVADIGTVEVEAGSRLRLVGTSATQHRLELARGVVHASVTAPPRLFVVDTPQATAVDLGCAYTLRVTADGTELTVESGLVALEGPGRTSTVLQGMRARARPGAAPTTPVAVDAAAELVAAVEAFDRAADPPALDTVFSLARPEDAATLWHLLPRADAARRAELGRKLAALVPPPRGWTPELGGSDAELMRQWWGELVRQTARRAGE